jgi:hypothetical protein
VVPRGSLDAVKWREIFYLYRESKPGGPIRLVVACRRFTGTYCSHLHGRNVNLAWTNEVRISSVGRTGGLGSQRQPIGLP